MMNGGFYVLVPLLGAMIVPGDAVDRSRRGGSESEVWGAIQVDSCDMWGAIHTFDDSD